MREVGKSLRIRTNILLIREEEILGKSHRIRVVLFIERF